jgi:D-hexose-6-phosphate mutarotase
MNSKNKISFVPGGDGLPMVRVETEWSAAEIYLHGAHVTHFQKRGEAKPILWLSRESRFEAGVAIRGGIPIILPWFGPREGKPAHGFARTSVWELKEINTTSTGAVSLHLQLPPVADAGDFPPFTADYLLTVGEALELQLTVTNHAKERELVFEECLHSYFTVGDIASVSVHGLKGTTYLDKVGGTTEKRETADAITVTGEVDRVYEDSAKVLEIRDGNLKRKILVEKHGSASTVVWNPWVAKSKAMADFGDDEYHQMICVESGNVGKHKLTLAPGNSGTLKVRLSTAPL